MVKSPNVSWQTFAKMADYKLNFREPVKDAIAAKTEGMNAHTGRENLWTPTRTAFPELLMYGRRCQPRVHVDRNIEILYSFPEDVVVVLVIMEHHVAVGSTRLPCRQMNYSLDIQSFNMQPLRPSSLTARVSSLAASAGSCILTDANTWNRMG